MARKLKTWPGPRMGRPEKYEWAKWLDGTIWGLKQGVDFDCTPASFMNAAYKYAKSRDIKVRVTMDEAEGTVALQAEEGE